MQLLGDDTVLEVNRDITEAKALITRQATLAAKFEALFNQSGIFKTSGTDVASRYAYAASPKIRRSDERT